MIACWLVCCACAPSEEPIDPARLAAIATRVEAIRGLAFETEVPGRWIDRAAVQALLEEEFDRAFPDEERAEDEGLLRDLGFWRGPRSLRSILLGHDAEWLAGFYDPTPVRILYAVRDPSFDPSFQEETLVHELVHALQDQHAPAFTLENGVEQDGDLLFAFSALREGAAQWVQYTDTHQRERWPILSVDGARAQAEIDLRDRDMPSLLSWGRIRVYSEGYAFARRLLGVAGTAALNRALSDPPISSQEILHPERYLAADRAVPSFPAATGKWAAPDCETTAGDVFGELGVAAWLVDHGREDVAERLAAGWDGDRAWRLRCAAGTTSLWLIQFARGEEAAEMDAAVRTLEAGDGLAPGLQAVQRGRRLLLHGGLPAAAVDHLLDELEVARLGGFADYLAADPGVHERAAQWSREADGAPSAAPRRGPAAQ